MRPWLRSRLLAALALDADELFVEVEVAQPQVAQLADAQAAAVEGLDDGAVALSFGLVHVHGVDDAVNFLHRQHFGQVEADFRAFQQLGGVGLQIIRQDQEVVERLHAGQDARLRAGVDADVVQARAEALQVVQADVQEVDALHAQEVQQLLQVALVGVHGVGREGLLQLQPLHVFLDNLCVLLLISVF